MSDTQKFPQYFAALSAAFGAFATGTILGWSSPAEKQYLDGAYPFEVTKEDFSWAGASMTLGAACVCMPIGFFVNLIGRKLTMLLLVIPFTIGWALLIWAQNLAMLYVARFLLGIAGGAFCVTAPLYTGEIAEKEIRGKLGSFFQLMITLGILFIYMLGWKLDVFTSSIIAATIPLIFGVIFFFMPETPLYYVGKGQQEKAVKSMKWLRGIDYDHQSELNDLVTEIDNNRNNQTPIYVALMRTGTRKALVISLGLMVFQQLSGINAVIFYTGRIFEDAQVGIQPSVATIIVGFIQIIATFISTMVVDKIGRRILLLASSSIMAVCTTFLGIYFYLLFNKGEDSVKGLGWLPITSLCIFIIMFSLGFGPVPWIMMGELFAADIKGFAVSLSGTANWLLAFIVTKTFVNLNDAIGIGATFWLFSAISISGTVFVFFLVPETKGKSLIEIQRMLAREKNET